MNRRRSVPSARLGDSLEQFLAQVVPDLKLRRLMLNLSSAGAGPGLISYKRGGCTADVANTTLPTADDAHTTLHCAAPGPSCRVISHKVKTASTGGTAETNVFGDEQLAVDMVADRVLFDGLRHSALGRRALQFFSVFFSRFF